MRRQVRYHQVKRQARGALEPEEQGPARAPLRRQGAEAG